jgi:putative SOS response-associated peptidase YedK
MCGRARLSSDVSEIKLVFSIPPHQPTPSIAPSWNVSPTDPLPMGSVGRTNRMSAGPRSDADEIIE